MSKFCIPSKGTNILQEEKALSTDGKKNSRSHEKTKSKKSTEIKHQYPLRENRATNFMALEPPDDDQFLYCEECNKEYEGNCLDHGPLIVVEDSKVPDACKKDQARATLPVGLTIKESGIPNAGLGVWADVQFSNRTRFGPYVGVITKDVDKVHATGYAWQIYKDGVASHFVDARDPAQSNWMRYINCARTEAEQNLTAYQYYGHIYYRAFKTIEPGKELLVWYGNEYGRDLGIVRDTKSFLKPKYVNGEEVYCCPWCRTSFSIDVFLAFHVKRIHGCKLNHANKIATFDAFELTSIRQPSQTMPKMLTGQKRRSNIWQSKPRILTSSIQDFGIVEAIR
ncbi:hypothetical protein ACJMK2_014966 [Sinanodonta woodiana]|uniref:SET domain-containing protein n=1 Tax=Sinanodonta woodiana TaxID=1069815 RepID=A0ABD3V278_SINWO